MPLNIKSPLVEALASEVATVAGESKTEAIRRALEERRARLGHSVGAFDRTARLRRFLERELWPAVPADARGRRLTRVEEDDILGFGPDGA
jgi:antitoxin VapB